MCSLFSITRLRSEPSRTMMDVTRDLIALSRPYFFGTTIFGVFSHAFSAIQIIKSSRFLLILFLLLLRLASRFQLIIGINSRGCVGKMLVFAYYFVLGRNALFYGFLIHSLLSVLLLFLAIALSLSLRPWLFLHFSGDAWTRLLLAWPTAIIVRSESNDRHVSVFSS